MRAEMIMIGTELLLGQIVDANAAYMGRVLAEHGIPLYQKTTVGDNQERIVRALHAALDRADVLLLSGGLGPTEDDLTRESIAALLNRPLEFREELLAQVTARFARMRRPMTENNRKQAFAPAGAIAIENPNGTAPGLIVEDERGVIIAMPGVPSELEAMLTERVVPYLRQKYGIAGLLDSRVLKIAGIGESRVDAVIGDLIQTQKNPTIGILASPDAVRIRITALAQCRTEAENMIAEVEGKLRRRLPQSIFGKDNDTLEAVVDGLFAQRGWSLATAETVSGGVCVRQAPFLSQAGWFLATQRTSCPRQTRRPWPKACAPCSMPIALWPWFHATKGPRWTLFSQPLSPVLPGNCRSATGAGSPLCASALRPSSASDAPCWGCTRTIPATFPCDLPPVVGCGFSKVSARARNRAPSTMCER